MSVLRNVNLSDEEDIVVQDERFDELEKGDIRVGTTGELSAGTGEGIQVTIDNPSDSGVEMVIFELVTFATSGPLYPHMFVNPDTGLPTTEKGIIDTNLDTDNSSNIILKADTGSTALSGGTDTGIEFGQNSNVVRRDVFFKISPGTVVGFDIDSAAIGTAEGSMSIWFVERKL